MTISPESILQFIQSAYQTFDRLNLSLEMLAGIALVVTIAFMFALREIAAWFFKIDDLKRDIRSLEESVGRLEAEIRNVQASRNTPKLEPITEPAPTSFIRRSEQFPINH
jgi:hypothetical protein